MLIRIVIILRHEDASIPIKPTDVLADAQAFSSLILIIIDDQMLVP